MAIILVRHGETALNAARVMQPAATPLSDRGRAQAQALGRRLATTGTGPIAGGLTLPSGGSERSQHAGEPLGRVAAILSSDLPRAWHTAEAIAAQVALPIQPSALLQERNFGDLRGRPYDTLGFDPLVMQEAPPGGESAPAFAQRVQRAFEQMLRVHAGLDDDLVVVTHGLLIRILLGGPLQLPEDRLRDLHLANTSVSIFDAAAPYTLRLLNCTRHLDTDGGDDARSLSGG
jgi:broad specificity phosphatase PhoE